MTTVLETKATSTVTPVLSTMQDIPLAHIRESKTNPRRQFDEAKLAELADFVSRNKIGFMFRRTICVFRPLQLRERRGPELCWQHNLYSEQSHFNKSCSFRQPAVWRNVSEVLTGGRHAATAACLVLRVISAYR